MAATLQLEDKLLVWEGCSVVDTSTVDVAGRPARGPGILQQQQVMCWGRKGEEAFRE